MKKETLSLDSLMLMGISTRTNNSNEMNPATAKISAIAGDYWGQQKANLFKHRSQPGITYVVYTDYESDEHGEYTYFMGEAVSSLQDQDISQFSALIIPNGDYQKFTTDVGKMPDIIISAWQEIWQMNEKDFAGKRRYIADFEVYDQRSVDPHQAVVDIYIGVTKP